MSVPPEPKELMQLPQPKTIIAIMAVCVLSIQLIVFFFRHSMAVLLGGILLCVILKYVRDLTT